MQNNETEENIDYLAAFKTQQNSQAQQIDLQGYNLENLGNMNTTTTTTVQNSQNINDINTDANQLETKINEYQVEAKTLEPIVKDVGVNFSVNKAIINETTNKILVSANTLPVSYLPEKVNKLIVSDQVTTLPLIRAGSKVFYNMKESTQTNTNDLNNINYDSNGTTSNNAAFDYNALIANSGQNEQNGFIEGNNYNYDYNFDTTNTSTNYQDSNNWTTTNEKTTYNTTNVVQTTSSQYNPEINYQFETQGISAQQGEQIQYGY